MVSICCITYNQEKYISDALNSFLMQKTDFEYEILIHDDASTDRTAEIIKEYEKKYPDIIKLIYQTENQYSKGVKVGRFNMERAKGKYIALCEGDDYWTDPFKLQKQVDFMEIHPLCSLCVHAAKKIYGDKKVVGYIRPSKKNRYYTTDDVILGGGGMFATNSMLFPTEYVHEIPAFFLSASISDYPLTILLSLKGNIFYMDSCMSAYRVMAKNSWSSSMQANAQKRIEHNKRIEKMLNEIDEYTSYEHTKAIKEHIRENEFNLYRSNFKINEIRSDKYAALYSELSRKQKIRLYVGAYFPSAVKLWRKIRS